MPHLIIKFFILHFSYLWNLVFAPITVMAASSDLYKNYSTDWKCSVNPWIMSILRLNVITLFVKTRFLFRLEKRRKHFVFFIASTILWTHPQTEREHAIVEEEFSRLPKAMQSAGWKIKGKQTQTPPSFSRHWVG